MRKTEIKRKNAIVEATLAWIDAEATFNLLDEDDSNEKDFRQKVAMARSALKTAVLHATIIEIREACKELGDGPARDLKILIQKWM